MDALPWMKLVYSALLAGLTFVLARELWTTWSDDRVMVGPFTLVAETGEDEAQATAFQKRVVAAEQLLSHQLKAWQAGAVGREAGGVMPVLPGMEALHIPAEALPGFEISYSDVNITQIFQKLRKGFRSPDEINGTVTLMPDVVQATVEWPNAPVPELKRFMTPTVATQQEAAAHIACTVGWATAASRDAQAAAVPREQFCAFALALQDWFLLDQQAAGEAGVDEAGVKRIRARVAALKRFEGTTPFPELLRLRAALIELLPPEVRTPAEIVDAQEDLVAYAMLAPELAKLSPDDARMQALALARPAILLGDGAPRWPANWAALLRPHADIVAAQAAAVGLLRTADGAPIGTGFLVGPGLMMTAPFVMEQITRSGKKAELCLGPDPKACRDPLKVTEALHDPGRSSHVGLWRVEGHDPDVVPPLTMGGEMKAGRTVHIIGFPFIQGHAVPAEFGKLLVGEEQGKRHLMPGRTLAVGPIGLAVGPRGLPMNIGISTPKPGIFAKSDVSSMSGMSGAPLIDLETGEVVGVHFGGVWKGDKGKFAWQEAISPEARAAWRKAMGIPEPAGEEGDAAADDKAPDSAAPPAPTQMLE